MKFLNTMCAIFILGLASCACGADTDSQNPATAQPATSAPDSSAATNPNAATNGQPAASAVESTANPANTPAQPAASTPDASAATPNTPAGTSAQPNSNAENSSAAANTNNPTNGTSATANGTAQENLIVYCPDVEKLDKKGMFWGSSGGWKSYSQSFVKKIDTFVGAQWVGVKVGKMLCIYKGSEKLEFPVVLQNDTLTEMPVRAKLPDSTRFNMWGSYTDGYVNCNSVDVNDCPFKRVSDKVDINKVYQELDFYKGKSDPNE